MAETTTASTAAERKEVLHKKLVFSILEFFQTVIDERPPGLDVEGLEVGVQCVQAAFGVDPSDSEHRERYAVDAPLEQTFRTGLAIGAGSTPLGNLVKQVFDSVKTEEEKEVAAEPLPAEVVQEAEEDEFQKSYRSYLAVLEEKGYFKDTTPGDGEYEARAEKARARLQEKVDAEKAQRKASAEAKKAEGNAKLSARDFAAAVALYGEAIELDPSNAIYYANRAAAHTHLRDHAAAVTDCKAAIARDPSYVKAYSRLGLAHFSQGQYKEAVEAYKKAAELEPANATVKESLKIAEQKLAAQAPAAAVQAGGHSHGPGAGGHSHGPGAQGMPDFSSLLNNPAMMNLMNQFGGMAGGGAGAPAGAAAGTGAAAPPAGAAAPSGGAQPPAGGMPQLGDLLNNPQMMGMAEQLLGNPAVGGLLNNPAIMNMATSMMQNPDMLSSVLSGLGGGAPGAPPGTQPPPQNQ